MFVFWPLFKLWDEWLSRPLWLVQWRAHKWGKCISINPNGEVCMFLYVCVSEYKLSLKMSILNHSKNKYICVLLISTWYHHYDLWFLLLLLTLIWSIWMYKQVIVDHLFLFLQHITNIWNTMLSLGDGKEKRVCLILLLPPVCGGAADICSALQRWSIFSQQKRAQWYLPAHSRAVRCRYPTVTRIFLFLNSRLSMGCPDIPPYCISLSF